jgi:hypothetical protein
MPFTLQCETVIADAVLQAARAALPADASRWLQLPGNSLKNQPLLPLLLGLIEATDCVANAIADNAWDDCQPLNQQLATDIAKQSQRIADTIINASQSPDCNNWTLPSATGKELI